MTEAITIRYDKAWRLLVERPGWDAYRVRDQPCVVIRGMQGGLQHRFPIADRGIASTAALFPNEAGCFSINIEPRRITITRAVWQPNDNQGSPWQIGRTESTHEIITALY